MGRMNMGVPVPERGEERQYRVVYPTAFVEGRNPPGGPVDLTFLEEGWFGCEIHFCLDEASKKYRSRLHVTMEPCVWCRPDRPVRWAGYIPAFDNHARELVVALLSAEAARQLAAHAVRFYGIMGQRFILARAGNKPNGVVVVKRSAYDPETPLPASFPIQPTLRRLFGLAVNPDRLTEGCDAYEAPLPVEPFPRNGEEGAR